jgi:hypothetical protein
MITATAVRNKSVKESPPRPNLGRSKIPSAWRRGDRPRGRRRLCSGADFGRSFRNDLFPLAIAEGGDDAFDLRCDKSEIVHGGSPAFLSLNSHIDTALHPLMAFVIRDLHAAGKSNQ